MDMLNQILSINNGGAYGGGKAGGAFDPLTFAMKPQVVIRALCWVSNSSSRAPSMGAGVEIEWNSAWASLWELLRFCGHTHTHTQSYLSRCLHELPLKRHSEKN